MKILDALKNNIISISCRKKVLTCSPNGIFYVQEIFGDSFTTFADEDSAVSYLVDDTKICKIINGKFSWQIDVDGQKVNINSTDYFEEHYKSLGYRLEYYREADDGTLIKEPNYEKIK